MCVKACGVYKCVSVLDRCTDRICVAIVLVSFSYIDAVVALTGRCRTENVRSLIIRIRLLFRVKRIKCASA